MSNTLTAYTPVVIAKTLKILREHLRIQKYVTTDYDSEMLPIGASLQIPVTAQLTASDITPASTPPALTSIAPTSVTLTLNKFKRAPFSITTSDLNTMMRNTDFTPAHLQEAARSIARQIIDDLWQNYVSVPYYVGTAGTNPFASSLATLALAGQSMDNTLADTYGRVMLISNAAKEKALELGNLIQAYQRGSSEVLDTGNLGELLGFQMERDSRVPTQTAGTASGAQTGSTVPTVGVTTSLTLTATGSGTINIGDVFTVAGDTQTYVATNNVAAVSGGSLTFYPAAQVAWSANSAITLKATHVVNLGMDRGAFALGMRQPRTDEMQINEVYPMIDSGDDGYDKSREATGMQFALSVVPNYWGATYEVVAFYGSCCLRPERAVRMAG